MKVCVQMEICELVIISESEKNEDKVNKIIDLNFGFPDKKVVGVLSGSSLMRD